MPRDGFWEKPGFPVPMAHASNVARHGTTALKAWENSERPAQALPCRRGSAFLVYLPAFVGKPEEEDKRAISLQGLQGKGERILLVEDEEEVREFVAGALAENGYFVWRAASAKEALNLFERERGAFDLLFSDLVLPDRTALQLVDQLLPRHPELRVLLGSGYTDWESQGPALCERGFRFIQKPYLLSDLLRILREVIEEANETPLSLPSSS